ncbi:MAG: DNA recombination protein RmuC [Bacteroidales bacterium]|nr:DNA recombination protein RmuC [Bacteroidales bacterium]
MTLYYVISILVIVLISVLAYFIGNRGKKNIEQDKTRLENDIIELKKEKANKDSELTIRNEEIKKLTAERDVQKNNAENYEKQTVAQKEEFEKRIEEAKNNFAARAEEQKETLTKQYDELKRTYEQQIAELKLSFENQLKQTKEAHEGQIEALKEMNKEQVKSQLDLIKEQMQTTSEKVLKLREEELGEKNKDQVSKIIDPLQKSLEDMRNALEKNKDQQKEALDRLDQTIKINMEKSNAIGETADRLTRALTGEVKVQGNFGELKLKQLLEDLELKEGEQYDTQETLRDNSGKILKGDDERGMIPDFILHFPNNRHVVVDSKMSLTDYERYMNAEDGTPEKSEYLRAHLRSVRAQVNRLAKKGYTKYLPDGYNRLTFAIMYIPIEGALNLALMNDNYLWKESYDQGVLILGPQTMYMNLRVLEMMWTQVRQLNNQQALMDAANTIIDRVQDFGVRFMDVESSLNDTFKKISKLKITTADSGPSIITAARNLLKAGASENKKKKSLAEMDNNLFIESDQTLLLSPNAPGELEKTSEQQKPTQATLY